MKVSRSFVSRMLQISFTNQKEEENCALTWFQKTRHIKSSGKKMDCQLRRGDERS